MATLTEIKIAGLKAQFDRAGVQVSYSPTPPSGGTKLILRDRGGLLPDGTVSDAYKEAKINRHEVPNPKAGDTFIYNSVTYKLLERVHLDNDIAIYTVE